MKLPFTLRLGSVDEPSLQVSKWLKVPALLDDEEMSRLIHSLGEFVITVTGSVTPQGKGFIGHEAFLEGYQAYIAALQGGQRPNEGNFRRIIPCVWTADLSALYAVPLAEGKQVIRACSPVIQLQHHRFDYSPIDGKFRSMVLGQDTIVWGVQFSYPQLYENPATHEIVQLNEEEAYPNTALFRKLQRWIRHETIPVPFQVEGKQIINVPIRLGKKCVEWIHRHPQLSARHLEVKV